MSVLTVTIPQETTMLISVEAGVTPVTECFDWETVKEGPVRHAFFTRLLSPRQKPFEVHFAKVALDNTTASK